jgi:hypothetical protein
MSHKTFLTGGLGMLLLLAACIPAVATPTGPGAEEVKSAIQTSVALTVAARETEIVASWSPTPSPTDTPVPTFTPAFPSLTAFPTSTPHLTGGGFLPTPSDYECTVTSKSPADNSLFKPKKDFDVKFYLKNSGTKRWDKGIDLLYHDGTNMLTVDYIYELPLVKPGETVGPFIFDAKSPNKAGTFVMTFKLQGGFCYPYIRIVVKN